MCKSLFHETQKTLRSGRRQIVCSVYFETLQYCVFVETYESACTNALFVENGGLENKGLIEVRLVE